MRELCEKRNECGLHGRIVKGSGASNPVLFLVGEAPGYDEDVSGLPFVGKAGQELDMYLKRFTKIPRANCFVTNVIKCKPPKNRDPKKSEIKVCKYILREEFEKCKPKYIGTIGRISTIWFLGNTTMEKVHGIPYSWGDNIVVPLYHPALGIHSPNMMRHIMNDFTILGEVVRGVVKPVKREERKVDYRCLS